MNDQPEPDELEVSIFGPGFGEAILVHVGNGIWTAIDSCIDITDGECAPLKYLKSIGVDVAQSLLLIVATHWHDDHVSGISTLLEAAEHAKFVCSAGVQTDDFLTLVGASQQLMLRETGLKEFAEIIGILRSRKRGPRLGAMGPTFAKAHGILWRGDAHGVPDCVVEALSPSDASMERAYQELASLLPESAGAKRRITPKTPNHTAVVVLVRVGAIDLLFGADLQERGTGVRGWSEILALDTLTETAAEIFKVAHHGSENADHPDVWANLLAKNPVALITPYNRGTFLPTADDRTRIRGHASEAYLTSDKESTGRAKRDRRVQRVLEAKKRDMRLADGEIGHVRARRRLETGDPWVITLDGPAAAL